MQMEIRGAERLSFREKQVVTLKEMGQATDAIAKKLNISASSVATMYNRAKAKGYQVVIVLSGDPLAIFSEEEAGND
ncbi:MAG: sigma factor-like helix-turn-helix DNA-binding protein [Clostridia bacterium]|jgi:transposase|nr:sigma factor-like helix-turn-helix DNA-binding protein [Clostridia bacterium]MDD4572147.1 sigma factor-like helix-turn-helix DNA-binding protein [Clostridia bacterium]